MSKIVEEIKRFHYLNGLVIGNDEILNDELKNEHWALCKKFSPIDTRSTLIHEYEKLREVSEKMAESLRYYDKAQGQWFGIAETIRATESLKSWQAFLESENK